MHFRKTCNNDNNNVVAFCHFVSLQVMLFSTLLIRALFHIHLICLLLSSIVSVIFLLLCVCGLSSSGVCVLSFSSIRHHDNGFECGVLNIVHKVKNIV